MIVLHPDPWAAGRDRQRKSKIERKKRRKETPKPTTSDALPPTRPQPMPLLTHSNMGAISVQIQLSKVGQDCSLVCRVLAQQQQKHRLDPKHHTKQAWVYMSTIQAPKKGKAGGLKVQGHFQLHNKFEDNLEYIIFLYTHTNICVYIYIYSSMCIYIYAKYYFYIR